MAALRSANIDVQSDCEEGLCGSCEVRVVDGEIEVRNTTPVGLAFVPGYDPLWVITKHADLIAVEKNAKLFHSGDENPILNDQANDAFIEDWHAFIKNDKRVTPEKAVGFQP